VIQYLNEINVIATKMTKSTIEVQANSIMAITRGLRRVNGVMVMVPQVI